MMAAADVHEVLDALDAAGVAYRLDGGWGVDALLGRETRAHEDLDLVVSRHDAREAALALGGLGFEHAVGDEPGFPTRLVLRDAGGRQVALQPVVVDGAGNGHQELGDGTWGVYPAAELGAEGVVAGRRVPCVSAAL